MPRISLASICGAIDLQAVAAGLSVEVLLAKRLKVSFIARPPFVWFMLW